MTEKKEWLEFWGFIEGTDESELAWQAKQNMTVNQCNLGIISDIQPYKSMITGEIIHSRARHRTHLKDHNVVEIGNEVESATRMPEPKRANFKDEIIKQVYLAKESLRNKH